MSTISPGNGVPASAAVTGEECSHRYTGARTYGAEHDISGRLVVRRCRRELMLAKALARAWLGWLPLLSFEMPFEYVGILRKSGFATPWQVP
jgi:hypothetical protein